MPTTSPHQTLLKFGYPDTLIHDYDHWSVLLRPKQVTFGSLVMIAKSPVTAFSELPEDSFKEMPDVISDIERTLSEVASYQKINYLTLMMVDPQVHSHVIPRYEGSREFSGICFEDRSWPGPPDLTTYTDCPDKAFEDLLDKFKNAWP